MESHTLSIGLAQSNMLVGDIQGNSDKIVSAAVRARDQLGCDLVVFPELSITGYLPEDLLQRPDFLAAAEHAVTAIAARVSGISIMLGHPQRQQQHERGAVYNTISILRDGHLEARYYKQALPNYGVFDEKRYFIGGDRATVFTLNGITIGVTICEDLWEEQPLQRALAAGADLIINCNGSPFYMGRGAERERMLEPRIAAAGTPLVYVNQVGGQDELVYDGGSFVMDGAGRVIERLPYFEEALGCVRFDRVDGAPPQPRPGTLAHSPTAEAGVYGAIVLGVRDYVTKNGFDGAVIGLSGGVDSALTLALAVDALGAEAVEAVLMPSRHTRPISIEDAEAEARTLAVAHRTISIEPLYEAFLAALAPRFQGLPTDTTEENLQARCRGVLLMAISNKSGKILLTTGNKSEIAVGYATLYGDMAGGFGVIKDVPKTLVYQLAAYRNSISPVIPQRVLERAPSAELAPDQQDEDSLPPYPQLDKILEDYIERDLGIREIIANGHDPATVRRVISLVTHNEYKRRQSAPGVRITPKAFGRDRRYPITARFDHEWLWKQLSGGK